MAGDPIVQVRQQLVSGLAALMPAITGGTQPVPVNYSYPGQAQEREHLWFNGGLTPMSIPSMKAGRKRREVTTSLELIVEVMMVGRGLDAQGANLLQVTADERREELVTIVSEFLADDPLVGFTDRTIDWCELTQIDRSEGPTENGVGSRAVLTLTYHARLL